MQRMGGIRIEAQPGDTSSIFRYYVKFPLTPMGFAALISVVTMEVGSLYLSKVFTEKPPNFEYFCFLVAFGDTIPGPE